MNDRKTLRVGIVARLTEPGGVQSVALSMIKALNSRGIVPDVLWDVKPSASLLAGAGVRAGFRPVWFPLNTFLIDKMPLSLRYLAFLVNAKDGSQFRREYDFAYTVNQIFVFPKDFPHLYYLSGPPLLPQLDLPPPGLKGVPLACFKWTYRTFLRKSRPIYDYQPGSTFVINSHYTARLFKEAHGIDLPVVHPPIDVSGRRYEQGDLAKRDSMVFFSRIVAYKRPGMILDLCRHHRQLRCVIMGGVQPHRRPFYEELRRTAENEGLGTIFLDNPSDRQVRVELTRAKFYVFPAVNEHFGMTTPEAIASGAIPFVHDSGGQVEIVPDDRLRFTDDQFLSKFSALVATPDDELEKIRKRLNTHIRQYSEEAFIGKMLAYLDRSFDRAVADAGHLSAQEA